MDTPYFHIVGTIFLAGGILVALHALGDIISKRRGSKVHTYKSLIRLIESMYSVGLGAKMLIVGPAFIRWHLTDFGFTVAIAALLYVAAARGAKIDSEYERKNYRLAVILEYDLHRVTLVLALLLSYGYEVTVWFIYRQHPKTEVQFVGNFDWIDMLMYTLGAIAAFVCYRSIYLAMMRDVEEYEEATRNLEAAQVEYSRAAKAARKASRKKQVYTAKKRRGGRR